MAYSQNNKSEEG